MPEMVVEKSLSPNDIGDTRSHQAGILVPKTLVDFFPSLDESALNPRASLHFETEQGVSGGGAYIHYNNKLVAHGTRDEYRITRIRALLRKLGAAAGDTLELVRMGTHSYRVTLRRGAAPERSGALVVDVSRGWRTVKV